MSKIRILGVALFAVFAFGAISATAAFAESEWLVEGKPITTAEGALNAETVGELTLIRYSASKSATVLTEVVCSGIFDGTIGPGATDKVTSVLTLAGVAVGVLGGTALMCNVTKDEGGLTDCETGTANALVWAENLPWTTAITLSGSTFLDTFTGTGGQPAYEVECKALIGITGSELCEGPAVATLTNETMTSPASVLGMFEKVTVPKRGTCASTITEAAENIGDGNTWVVDPERLVTAVS